MQFDRRITRSMSAAISTNMSASDSNIAISNQTEIEKIDNKIKTLENTIKSLEQELNESKKVKYELEPTITVTDKYSGRTFTVKKNPYELSLQYPKIHPETGQRLYEKTKHWHKHNGKYMVTTFMDCDFPDTEYVKNTSDLINGRHYKLYDSSVGWSRPGYYWHDCSSDYDYCSRYVETHLPDANANANKNGKKK